MSSARLEEPITSLLGIPVAAPALLPAVVSSSMTHLDKLPTKNTDSRLALESLPPLLYDPIQLDTPPLAIPFTPPALPSAVVSSMTNEMPPIVTATPLIPPACPCPVTPTVAGLPMHPFLNLPRSPTAESFF